MELLNYRICSLIFVLCFLNFEFWILFVLFLFIQIHRRKEVEKEAIEQHR